MIKRFINFILAASIIFGCTAYAWEPIESNTQQNARELLKILDIIDTVTKDGYKDNDIITRGELADVVMRLSGKYDSVSYADYFEDVTEDTEYAASIATLTAMGIIAEDDKFYPQEPARYEHAVKMIVYLLGYDALAEYEGGWLAPIFSIASNIGLTKGISAGAGNEVNAAMLSALAFNALDCTVMERTVSNDFETDKEKTLLTENFDIYKVKGIVSANNKTSLTKAESRKNEIVIGNTAYGDDELAAQDYLGMEVVAYYLDDKSDTEIVYAYPTSKNSVLTVKAGDIEEDAAGFGYTNVYYTEPEKDKLQRVKIDEGADVIYNGKAYPEFSGETFKIESGNIRFIDNNNDGSADVVFVNESETFVVDIVNNAEMQIYDMYGKYIALEDAEYLNITDMYGTKLELNQLTQWNVLSVVKSLDGEIVEIVVYDDPVMGDVRAVWTEDGKTYANIDGEVFRVSSSYMKAVADKNSKSKEIVVGQEGTYYLDADECIAAVVLDETNSWRYGYLIKTYMDDATERLRFKIMCDNSGAKFYDGAEYVKIDGYKKESNNAYKELCLDENREHTGGPVPQLIKFMMDGKGFVTKIDTANQTDRETKENLNKVVSKGKEYWSIRTGRFGTDERVGIQLDTSKTLIFQVPDDDIYNEEKYSLRKISFNNNDYITYDAYDTDFSGLAKAIVVYGENESSTINYDRTLIVSEVQNTLNADDEIVTVITGFNMSGQKVTKAVNPDKNTSEISVGDILTYTLDYKDDIDVVHPLFERKKDLGYTETRKIFNSTGDYRTEYTSNAKFYMTANVIADKEGNYIKTMIPGTIISSIIKSEINLSNSQTYSLSDAVIYLFDSSAKGTKVRQITPAETEEYVYLRNKDARAVIFTTYSQLRCVYIYK